MEGPSDDRRYIQRLAPKDENAFTGSVGPRSRDLREGAVKFSLDTEAIMPGEHNAVVRDADLVFGQVKKLVLTYGLEDGFALIEWLPIHAPKSSPSYHRTKLGKDRVKQLLDANGVSADKIEKLDDVPVTLIGLRIKLEVRERITMDGLTAPYIHKVIGPADPQPSEKGSGRTHARERAPQGLRTLARSERPSMPAAKHLEVANSGERHKTLIGALVVSWFEDAEIASAHEFSRESQLPSSPSPAFRAPAWRGTTALAGIADIISRGHADWGTAHLCITELVPMREPHPCRDQAQRHRGGVHSRAMGVLSTELVTIAYDPELDR